MYSPSHLLGLAGELPLSLGLVSGCSYSATATLMASDRRKLNHILFAFPVRLTRRFLGIFRLSQSNRENFIEELEEQSQFSFAQLEAGADPCL